LLAICFVKKQIERQAGTYVLKLVLFILETSLFESIERFRGFLIPFLRQLISIF